MGTTQGAALPSPSIRGSAASIQLDAHRQTGTRGSRAERQDGGQEVCVCQWGGGLDLSHKDFVVALADWAGRALIKVSGLVRA